MTHTTTLRTEWGKRIERLRTEHGLSRAHFAHEVGIDQASVWRIEKGYQTPGDDVRVRIATALGVTVESIFVYSDTTKAAS